MAALSLTDVINDLAAGRMQALTAPPEPARAPGELAVFIDLDPVLATLNQQYLYARRNHATARKQHGSDSPMADIAADMEDSAWCAMQTRLMELRAQGDMMRRVQKIMWEAERAAQKDIQDEKDRRALTFFYRLETAQLIKKKNKSSVIYEWLAMIIIFHRFMRLPFPCLGVPEQRIAA